MAIFTITAFSTFAGLLVAGAKLATDPDPINRLKALADLATNGKALAAALSDSGLSPLVAEMTKVAEEIAAHFTHPGPARDDAIALFWQVAPVAFSDPSVFAAADLDAATATDRMIAEIKASSHARDFFASTLPETFFRQVTHRALTVMLDQSGYIATITPTLWRQTLSRHGVQIELLQRIGDTTRRTETKVDALPDAIVAKLMAELGKRDEIEDARRAGISAERILGLARRIADDVPDLDRAFAELEQAVGIAIEVQALGHAGSNTGNFVDAVLARMAELSADGLDDEAAAEADRAFAEWEERRREDARRGVELLGAGFRADVLRRDPVSAAKRIASRIDILTPDPAMGPDALWRAHIRYFERGRDLGLTLSLRIAVELLRLALGRVSIDDRRGAFLSDFGVALAELGDRETGTALFEEALAAYQSALRIRTRDRNPHDWAVVQNNLGNVLARLGARGAGTTQLEEAVAAFRSSLEERTRDRDPREWVMTQTNLAGALTLLAERGGDVAYLREAVRVLEAVLDERTRCQAPLAWAAAQCNLGSVRAVLGRDLGDTALLEKALAAYRSSLEVFTREHTPTDWASVQNNLGTALLTLAEREAGTSRLEEAVAAHYAALEVRNRERLPSDWAASQLNLGAALSELGARSMCVAQLESAIAAYQAALTVWTSESEPRSWAMSQNNIGNALLKLDTLQADSIKLAEAVSAYKAALAIRTQDGLPFEWAATQNNLGTALLRLGKRDGEAALLDQAVVAYRAALQVRTRDRVLLEWAATMGNLGDALAERAGYHGDLPMALEALEKLVVAEEVLRSGGHTSSGDFFASRIRKTTTLIDWLRLGVPFQSPPRGQHP
ncbi:MAG: tetratricopeptide repeat protein [Amaricoccus sp.]|uniref:tetratricopeptide repeat protein n=1 Tax=Amaricoccus sp. TaxID=1872485 RepID=UPI00331513C2